MYFEPGQDVVTEGEDGNTMFIIYDGTADVYSGNNKLKSLSRGDYFGELTVLGGGKRSETVRAHTNLKLIEIRKQIVHRLKQALE